MPRFRRRGPGKSRRPCRSRWGASRSTKTWRWSPSACPTTRLCGRRRSSPVPRWATTAPMRRTFPWRTWPTAIRRPAGSRRLPRPPTRRSGLKCDITRRSRRRRCTSRRPPTPGRARATSRPQPTAPRSRRLPTLCSSPVQRRRSRSRPPRRGPFGCGSHRPTYPTSNSRSLACCVREIGPTSSTASSGGCSSRRSGHFGTGPLRGRRCLARNTPIPTSQTARAPTRSNSRSRWTRAAPSLGTCRPAAGRSRDSEPCS